MKITTCISIKSNRASPIQILADRKSADIVAEKQGVSVSVERMGITDIAVQSFLPNISHERIYAADIVAKRTAIKVSAELTEATFRVSVVAERMKLSIAAERMNMLDIASERQNRLRYAIGIICPAHTGGGEEEYLYIIPDYYYLTQDNPERNGDILSNTDWYIY